MSTALLDQFFMNAFGVLAVNLSRNILPEINAKAYYRPTFIIAKPSTNNNIVLYYRKRNCVGYCLHQLLLIVSIVLMVLVFLAT